MNANTFFELIPPGCGSRWAFGSVILMFLIVYNESCGPTTVFSLIFSMLYALFAANCKSGLRNLQIPYIRATNKLDFTFLFLATWMDILTILSACAALARTVSSCLDAMTGGLARIFILGRNSPTNEPWPDVLGVMVVFIVTGMFMLGLENSRIFSCLMTLGLITLNIILTYVSFINGDMSEWALDYLRPNGFNTFLLATALSTFLYPIELPVRQGWKHYLSYLIFPLICVTMILTAICLSTIVHQKEYHDYIAVPLFSILNQNGGDKLIAVAACFLLIVCSTSFLELFPELYKIFVKLATSEWKIFLKQISYENSDSGNPVLAVFIAGSLCAMLAFACPLQNLTYMMAASHLLGNIFRAFYLLYFPFRPKYIPQTNDSNLSYSRLDQAAPVCSNNTNTRRSLWNINLSKTKKKRKTKRNDVDKEWLLLGEPSSPCPLQKEKHVVESSVLSDGEQVTSDFEFTTENNVSESDDSSTDIDAIVDEYRQKITVTTAGPMDKNIRMPSIASWRVTLFAILIILFGIFLVILGISLYLPPVYIVGLTGILLVSIMMSFIPRYSSGSSGVNVSPIICTSSITIGTLLISACMENSWPAILFWISAGLIFLIRCDKWCCICLNGPPNEHLLEHIAPIATRSQKFRNVNVGVIETSRQEEVR